MILFPAFVELKQEVERLRSEFARLVLERDDLVFTVCRNLEAQYMLVLGGLEYRVYEAECAMRRLRRKLEILQARRNRQETVSDREVEAVLDREFAQYQEQLQQMTEKMNAAIARSRMQTLGEEETKELRRRYLRVVKALHPDVHPEQGPERMELFRKTVQAYENGDLELLRAIEEMVSEPVLPEAEENAMTVLYQEQKRLKSLLEKVREEIRQIQSRFPFTVRELLADEEKISWRREELNRMIEEYQTGAAAYEERIRELRREAGWEN